MLLPAGLSGYAFTYDNWNANPSSSIGNSIVPGASNAEGAWTQIASPAQIAEDCYWIHLNVHSGGTSAAAKNHLLDLGIDPTGGTSYVPFFENLQVGSAPSLNQAGNKEFCFPVFIPAGSRVAVRIQGNAATAGNVRVAARFFGQPTRPEAVPVGMFAQTFGTVTDSNGQGFTPGNAADGSWVDLGVVERPLWWFQLGYGLDNTVVTAEYTYIDVAVGDASNKQILFRSLHVGQTSETAGFAAQPHLLACAAYFPVAAGQRIYVRGRCGDAPDTGYHATVIGIGG